MPAASGLGDREFVDQADPPSAWPVQRTFESTDSLARCIADGARQPVGRWIMNAAHLKVRKQLGVLIVRSAEADRDTADQANAGVCTDVHDAWWPAERYDAGRAGEKAFNKEPLGDRYWAGLDTRIAYDREQHASGFANPRPCGKARPGSEVSNDCNVCRFRLLLCEERTQGTNSQLFFCVGPKILPEIAVRTQGSGKCTINFRKAYPCRFR